MARLAMCLAVSLLAGCRATDPHEPPTGQLEITHSARLEGVATALDGLPMDSVDVDAVVGHVNRGTFTSVHGISGTNGRFSVLLERVETLGPLGPDTITVLVRASAIKRKYVRPNGTFPNDTVRVLVTLAKAGQPVVPKVIDMRVPVAR